MNALIIREGYAKAIPPLSLLEEKRPEKVFLLYLSPKVLAFEYKEELKHALKREVEIINPKNMVDFENTRKKLRDFIAALPQQLKVGKASLTEYLSIQGLSMWWSSGVVEATPYKRDLLQNLYYLTAVRNVLDKYAISAVWFEVEDPALNKDLAVMLDSLKIKYNRDKENDRFSGIKSFLVQVKLWLLFFGAFLLYSLFFKIIYPRRLKPLKTGENIHLFWTYYPSEVRFRDNRPEAKIYQELPLLLSKEFGGKDYHLSYISPVSLFYFFRMVKDLKEYWKNDFRLIPMNIFISLWDLLRIFLSPIRFWKYFSLRRIPQYRTAFNVEGINMFHTFDRTISDSLIGCETYMNLIHFHAFRNFCRRYKNNIFHVIYQVEFHNWEAALNMGVKNADNTIPVIGLQQSAPSPILLNFFFTPAMFKKEDSYPFPDLLLCSGELYKDLMLSGGVEPERVKVIGHILNRYLRGLPLTAQEKQKKRLQENLPIDRKICLIPGSVSFPLTKAIIYFLKDVVRKVPEVIFLLKEHPQCPVEPLLAECNIDKLENLRTTQKPVEVTLPLADYFLSLSTSVSQEALSLGLPQANLDVSGLPQANPLHLIPGFIQDIESPDGLLNFFVNPEKFSLPKEKAELFIGDLNHDVSQLFLKIIKERFHHHNSIGETSKNEFSQPERCFCK